MRDIQSRNITRAILTATVTVLSLWLAFRLRDAIVIVFLAFLLASALYPAVAWLERHKAPRAIGILFLYGLFLAAATCICVLASQLIMTQGTSLYQQFPSYLQAASAAVAHVPGIKPNLAKQTATVMSTISSHSYALLSSTVSYVGSITAVLIGVLSVLLLAFFMLLQTADIGHTLLSLVPGRRRQQVSRLFRNLALKAGAYVRGQFVVASAIGVMIWIGLSILGVPYAPMLGLLAFVFDLVPIIGSIAASVLGVLVALVQSPILAGWTFIVYLAANQIEQNIVSPFILGRAVGIGTFWILVSLLCGSILYGLAGLYLAIPCAVLVKLAVQEFWLNDHHPTPSISHSIPEQQKN